MLLAPVDVNRIISTILDGQRSGPIRPTTVLQLQCDREQSQQLKGKFQVTSIEANEYGSILSPIASWNHHRCEELYLQATSKLVENFNAWFTQVFTRVYDPRSPKLSLLAAMIESHDRKATMLKPPLLLQLETQNSRIAKHQSVWNNLNDQTFLYLYLSACNPATSCSTPWCQFFKSTRVTKLPMGTTVKTPIHPNCSLQNATYII